MACPACVSTPALLLALSACVPPSRPIVAEVYYDATGDDTGWEFVELFNPHAAAVPLAGLKLEAGDGAAPGRWTTRWTGGALDSIRAGGRFVIGGARWDPPPDALITLELQNGPDALRILWPDGGVETVGWGALAAPEYYCGSPAPDVSAGESLARVPDGADRGANALDFRAAAPSPGRANQPDVDRSIVRGTLALLPPSPEPGEAVWITARVATPGALARDALVDTLSLAGDALAEPLRVALAAAFPGETLLVGQAALAGAAGRRTLFARVEAGGDGDPANDADSIAVRVGAGPLELTEIQFHPAAGEGEWVEVRNRSGTLLSLADFTLSDRGDARARVLDTLAVAPDSLALLAQDRASLLAAFAGLDATRVARVSSWPSLNNTNGADGTADDVTLREADGLPSDRVAYSATGVPTGASLEKDRGLWRPSSSPAGTPLAPPREPDVGAAAIRVEPRRLTLAAPEVRLAWRLPWREGRVFAALYDMEGRRVAQLLDDVPSAAVGERLVRLDGAGAGVFAVVLRARGGGEWITRTALVRIAGSRP